MVPLGLSQQTGGVSLQPTHSQATGNGEAMTRFDLMVCGGALMEGYPQ